MNNIGRNAALWFGIGLLLLVAFNMFGGSSTRQPRRELSYTEFTEAVERRQVPEVLVRGSVITGLMNDGRMFSVYTPPQTTSLADRLVEKGVRVRAEPPEEPSPSFFQILLSWFPTLLIFGVWIFILRQMQGGNSKAMGFGKSRARLLTEKSGRITFADVAGIEEAKEELFEVVDFLRDPQKFQRLGGKIPKGVLLAGPPGTGKTLLARAIAGEANVPFFSISGSDFVEMFVGVGASRVRDMFEQGKKNAPCIIFIDEIDAVGRHRGAGMGGGNDEREQTLNQLLVEMDGFESSEGVILIAATNRPDVLDPALLRPGRFDRQVVVPNPDVAGREKILEVHTRKVPLGPDVKILTIARGTPGFSGADLANLVNEAALMAARKGKRFVTQHDLEQAKDKVMMGAERRSMVMTDDEKKLTAYHEAGHALVALHTPASDPIHKATIIPRGRALGMVVRLPENDRISMSRDKLKADLAVAMGGRVAEEVIFGSEKVTTGASSDIKMASDIARRMVTEWGMSDKLGPLTYGEPHQEMFLSNYSMGASRSMSEATTQLVDSEIKRIVDEAYQKAHKIIKDNSDQLHHIAQGLLAFETLSGEEVELLMRGEKIVRADDADAYIGGQRRRSSLPPAAGKKTTRSKSKPAPDTSEKS